MIKGECWASVEVCTRLWAFRVYSFILKHALMHQFICWEVCVYEYLSCCCLTTVYLNHRLFDYCISLSSPPQLPFTSFLIHFVWFDCWCWYVLQCRVRYFVPHSAVLDRKRQPELLVNNLSCCLGWGFQCSCFAEGRLKSAWKPHSHVSRRPGNVCLPLHPSSPDSTRHVYVIYMTRMSLFHHFMCYQRLDN